MKKLSYLMVLTLILGLVLTGCLLSNVGQVPTSEQSGITYLTKSPGSLVGLWHFDETSGTTATDSSGANDGTLHNFGSPWVSGMFGQALSFDGDDDYVDCGTVPQLNGLSEFTVEFWIKVDTLPFPDEWQGIIARGSTFQRTPWIYGNKNKRNLRIHFETIVGGAGDCNFVTNDLTAGQWHHVAFTWNGNMVSSYLDGVPGPTDTTTGSVLADTDESLKFGFMPSYTYFNGTIDEVRIWDTAYAGFEVSATPEVDFNLVETEHEITATIDPVAPGVTVGFEVIGGPNESATASDQTDARGQVTLSYTGSPNDGKDVIRIWVDRNWNGSWDEGVDYAVTVEKYWLKNFVTGGGKINMSTFNQNGGGKKAALTFGGTVGVLEGEGIVGIVGQFHMVGHTGGYFKGAVSYHCNNFIYLEFSGGPAESPDATYNTAKFTGTFTNNRSADTDDFTIIIEDKGEPGAGNDTFEIWVNGTFYDKWTIDGGNFQVHNIE